ncbi:MAG TPA: MarR family transcriptional regulator [Gaiellaceae bacterium]|nr:MarR family transcriptional regulator [Gaiellaceae bacterium]
MPRRSLLENGAPELADLVSTAAFRTQLRRFLHRTEAVTAEAGLTAQRYDLLLMVKTAEGGKTTVSQLSESLDLSQQGVTELVKRAVEAGLVRREKSAADGRVSLIELTRDGDRRLRRAFQSLAEDRAEFARALEHVRVAFSDSGASS